MTEKIYEMLKELYSEAMEHKEERETIQKLVASSIDANDLKKFLGPDYDEWVTDEKLGMLIIAGAIIFGEGLD